MWVPPGYLLSESNNKLLCPYLIDSDAAVFWSYYTRFKTKKAKICIHIGLLRPHFCLLHKIFDVTILLNQVSFFVRWNIMKFCPGRQYHAMYEVMRSFGAIKTKNALTLCVWRDNSRVHTFGPRMRKVNTAYSRDVFRGSEARKT